MRGMGHSVGHEDRLIGDPCGVFGLVGDHYEGRVCAVYDFGHEVEHFVFQRGAKGGEGFV